MLVHLETYPREVECRIKATFGLRAGFIDSLSSQALRDLESKRDSATKHEDTHKNSLLKIRTHKRRFRKHNTYHLSFVVKTQCLVAHLVVVIVGGLVVLVIILLIVHRVRVDLVPVNVLSARATAALDNVLLGDGLEVAVVLFVLVI